tara:strand:- start:3245 stop:3550 length:306 start_codon:yes stop_codon:yes gene_type:complete
VSDLFFLISEESLAVFIIVVLLGGIGIVARWFATYFANRMDNQFSELLREIAEMQQLITENNNKLYGITEKLIANQRLIGEDINALESSLDTLLKYIKADK